MKLQLHVVLAAAIAAVVAVASVAPADPTGDSSPPADLARAEELFGATCAPCHGDSGRGDGPAAPYFDPKPRDLTKGVFRIKSTPAGLPPSDEDLFRTIANGVPGTGMPAWGGKLSEDKIRLLVAYVKSRSRAFRRKRDGEPLVAPAEVPAATPALLARGRALYRDAEGAACFQCHGLDGRGEGPSAGKLTDESLRRLRPRDLTRPWTYKRGARVEQVFLTLAVGMDGAAMPSYADAISEADRWALAHYVVSLMRERSWIDCWFLDDPYLTPPAE